MSAHAQFITRLVLFLLKKQYSVMLKSTCLLLFYESARNPKEKQKKSCMMMLSLPVQGTHMIRR